MKNKEGDIQERKIWALAQAGGTFEASGFEGYKPNTTPTAVFLTNPEPGSVLWASGYLEMPRTQRKGMFQGDTIRSLLKVRSSDQHQDHRLVGGSGRQIPGALLTSWIRICILIFYLFIWLHWVLVVALRVFVRSHGIFIAVHGLSNGVWAYQLLHGKWNPQLGIKLTSPALQGGFLTTGSPGKSQNLQFTKIPRRSMCLWKSEKQHSRPKGSK